ncbi:hypothetical protein BDZ89DRAFT_187946 [Hymenopellis radicata]|nr:hypothetical protein BDZ89DRAFT_187946 [Hymenopellis radicata]
MRRLSAIRYSESIIFCTMSCVPSRPWKFIRDGSNQRGRQCYPQEDCRARNEPWVLEQPPTFYEKETTASDTSLATKCDITGRQSQPVYAAVARPYSPPPAPYEDELHILAKVLQGLL